MPRKRIIFDDEETVVHSPDTPGDSPNDLISLCESYIVNKDNESKFKRQASSDNEAIKKILSKSKDKYCVTSKGTVKYVSYVPDKFNEDALIDFLKQNNLSDDIIKTKEYVDYDVLESAIYTGKITGDMYEGLNKCKENTLVEKLTISKSKKGE